MAKFALVFIFGFLLVQFVAAAVVKRDAPTANSGQQSLEDAFKQFQDAMKSTFNQENFNKLGDTIQKFGAEMTAKGKELLNQANENVQKLKTPE